MGALESRFATDNLQHPFLSFHQLHCKSIDGRWVDFSQFKGKTVLAVNVASD